MNTKSPLTTSIKLTTEQVYALNYAISVGIVQGCLKKVDPRLIKELDGVLEIVQDRIEAIG